MDMNRFLAFLSDPMSAHKAADLPLEPRALLKEIETGLKMQPPGTGLGFQLPQDGSQPSQMGLKAPEGAGALLGTGQPAAAPGVDWMKALAAGGMMPKGPQMPQVSPPGHVFVGGPRQVKLNPYQTALNKVPNTIGLAGGK